jgi:uncharacterized protein
MCQATDRGDIVPRLGTHVPKLGTNDAPSPLADALFGRAKGRVLALLFAHPDRAFYTREIIEALQVGQGAAQRELTHLARVGILTRKRQGRQVYYQANRDCPIFSELSGLVDKTLAFADLMRKALSPLASRIKIAFVFGSTAKGTQRAGSDVDVMVIGSAPFGEVVIALSPVQQALGREVNPVVYTEAELRDRFAAGAHYLTSVLRGPKVFLIGGRDDLERLVGTGMVDRA